MFETAGLSTVVIVAIRDIAERMRPPRALCVEFPLGLPLGKPRDAGFQHRVLESAFALLGKPVGPVLEDFAEAIRAEDTEPLLCSLPPRYDPDLHPAVDEAQALRHAYDRAVARNGRTTVVSHATADEIPGAIEKFVRVAQGEPWDEGGRLRTPIKPTPRIEATASGRVKASSGPGPAYRRPASSSRKRRSSVGRPWGVDEASR